MNQDAQPASSKIRQTPMTSAIQITEREISKTHQTPTQPAIQVQSEQSPLTEDSKKRRKWRRIRPKNILVPTEIMEIEGVRKITISPLAQNIIGCLVGEHITAEDPWKYISKEAFEDNLELHEESSEFLPIKNELLEYPDATILLIYIPKETKEHPEFYVCLTEPARLAVETIISTVQREREERLNNTIYKTVKPWKTWGSEVEVEALQENNNRALLAMEVEADLPIVGNSRKFNLKLAGSVNNACADLVSLRQTFANLQKKLIDASVQAQPAVTENYAQTVYRFPVNVATEYHYEFKCVTLLSEDFKENMKLFLDRDLVKLSDTMHVNNSINFYRDDYASLVRNDKYARPAVDGNLKPYTTLSNSTICHRKEIACLSWHPMWSGTIALAYADHKPCDYIKYDPNSDIVTTTMYDIIPVLLWSFKDNLNPLLLLETYRHITYLSFCPYDENILLGGCINGQIILWDITNKLKKVEEQEMMTTAQRRYRSLMASLLGWMKNTKDFKNVCPTVISQLQYSHESAVTGIKWISPYREITKSGQIKDIPEGEKRHSLQFLTSSLDGTVCAWDLNAKPLGASFYKPQRKMRRLKRRPSALTSDISPFRSLNRIFKPIFKVNILAPQTARHLPLSHLNVRITAAKYKERHPDPNRRFNITDRILYDPVLSRPTHPLVNQFIAGSTEGDFLIASWEGFDFNAGEVVNKETAKLQNFGKYHDGPIVAVCRSSIFPNIILTAGGKIFALWKTDFIGKPFMWRKGKRRYTHAVWNTLRPSLFRLSRDDGYTELWHLKTRCDQYISLIFITSLCLGPTTIHPLPMKQNVLACVDSKGTLILLNIAHNLTLASEADTNSIYELCEREINRKNKFVDWQDKWTIKHAAYIQAKKDNALMAHQQKGEELRRQKELLEMEQEQLRKERERLVAQSLIKMQPKQYEEWARQQWIIQEKERIMKIVLQQKSLDIQVLEKQHLPLVKLEKEEQQRKKRLDLRQGMAKQLFDDTVAMLFPEAIEEKRPPTPDPYAGGDSVEVSLGYFEKYKETVEKCEKYVNERQYSYRFNWLSVLKTGKKIRKTVDGYYTRPNHRFRMENQKLNSGRQTETPNLTLEIDNEDAQSVRTGYDVFDTDTYIESTVDFNLDG